jgi:hypothetical protein
MVRRCRAARGFRQRESPADVAVRRHDGGTPRAAPRRRSAHFPHPSSWLRHSKHFTVDEHVAVPELVDLAIVRRMRVVEDAYRAVSRELTKQEWSKRIMGLRYVDSMIRLTPALQ